MPVLTRAQAVVLCRRGITTVQQISLMTWQQLREALCCNEPAASSASPTLSASSSLPSPSASAADAGLEDMCKTLVDQARAARRAACEDACLVAATSALSAAAPPSHSRLLALPSAGELQTGASANAPMRTSRNPAADDNDIENDDDNDDEGGVTLAPTDFLVENFGVDNVVEIGDLD
jgi:hypothetical protein